MNVRIAIGLGLVLLLISNPVHAAPKDKGGSGSSTISIDFQGIIDGIVKGLGDVVVSQFLGFPDLLWRYFYDELLLKPLGLDDTANEDDIVSATGFFLTQQPDIEPFRGTIQKLSELLIVFLALGVIAVSVKAMWEMLTSEEPNPIETVIKKDILPLFLGAFAIGLSVEIYQIVLYIARLIAMLFMVNVDYAIYRNLTFYLIYPDLLGLLSVAIVFLFVLFLVFTFILELVNAFLLPIFITLRALPFDITKAMGQGGLNFVVINAFMPIFSAMMIFIATSVWSSVTFWESLTLDGFALSLTRRLLGMVFLLLAVLIPVSFYFATFIIPVIRYAIAIKILKGVNMFEKAGSSHTGRAAGRGSSGLHPAQQQLRRYYRQRD